MHVISHTRSSCFSAFTLKAENGPGDKAMFPHAEVTLKGTAAHNLSGR